MTKKASNPTPDVFATALKVPKTKPKAKNEKEQIPLGEDLDTYAAASAILKSLEVIQVRYEAKLKAVMSKLFAHMGNATKGKPTNFEGVGPTSSASCELRKRSTSSILTEEESKILREKGISLEEKVIREEAYLFNSDILADPVLRKRVSDALSKIDFGDINPILHQEREVKNIVADDGIDQLFRLAETEDEALSMLPTVGVLALKPKFNGTLADAVAMLEVAGITLS